MFISLCVYITYEKAVKKIIDGIAIAQIKINRLNKDKKWAAALIGVS
jgi:hypothetical protein